MTATVVLFNEQGDEVRLSGGNLGFSGTGPDFVANLLKELGVDDVSVVYKARSRAEGLVYVF